MTFNPLDSARATIALEVLGLEALATSLDSDFSKAFDLLKRVGDTGRVIVSGMGKSGHIARKIAATLASTGTPSQFVHPAEASHGDLGMITTQDVIIALSWSGETGELSSLINYARRFAIPLIAITSNPASTLGQNATICLTLPPAQEAWESGRAPTTSTTMQLALGDALAVALLTEKNFTTNEFQNFHPGGNLGAALRNVSHAMHSGAAIPLIAADVAMPAAIQEMTQKGLGCIGIIDDAGALMGIITDGDLRRNINDDLIHKCAADIMTKTPITIKSDCLAGEALVIMRERKIQCLFVCENKKPIGLVRFLDLLEKGVA